MELRILQCLSHFLIRPFSIDPAPPCSPYRQTLRSVYVLRSLFKNLNMHSCAKLYLETIKQRTNVKRTLKHKAQFNTVFTHPDVRINLANSVTCNSNIIFTVGSNHISSSRNVFYFTTGDQFAVSEDHERYTLLSEITNIQFVIPVSSPFKFKPNRAELDSAIIVID